MQLSVFFMKTKKKFFELKILFTDSSNKKNASSTATENIEWKENRQTGKKGYVPF